jgi:chromosomal replication initiator protein
MSADKDIVAAVQAALAQRIGHHRYELWFGTETQLQCQGSTLIIHVPNRFFQAWIAANFRSDLAACCQEVLGFCPEFRFEVADGGSASSSPSGPSPGRKRPTEPKGACCANGQAGLLPLFSEPAEEPTGAALSEKDSPVGTVSGGAAAGEAVSESGALEASSAPNSVSGTSANGVGVGKRRAPGGPAGSLESKPAGNRTLPGRRFADFDSFITGPSNQLARSSAEMVVASPGTISPLVLCGPTGVGKTHLLEAIWTALRRRYPALLAVYVSAEEFTSSYVEALRVSGVPNFRRKYRGVDVLLIDDLQFFGGKRSTQQELLYTIEALQQAGRQLVFAASDPPREVPGLLPDLAARLDSGVVCRIAPPEYETRLRLVAQYARRMGMSMPEEVAEFVAGQFRHHAWELSGAVCRLHAALCATGENLTVEFARRVLADMLAARQHVVQLADIRNAVCEVFQIEPAGLCGRGKQRQLSYPRMLAMWLARKYTRAALSEIGQFFGGRSHSTVLFAQKQVERWLSQGRPLRLAGTLWYPEEAIRQVEKCLQVG